MYTAVESHFTHATVGSAASGIGSGGVTSASFAPVARVTGSNVV